MLKEIKSIKREARRAWVTTRWGRSGTVLTNSVPKSGSLMLLNLVLAIPGARVSSDTHLASSVDGEKERLQYVKSRMHSFGAGQIHAGHIPHSEDIEAWLDENEVRQLFIYRDPRDVTVSLWRYIMKPSEEHPYFEMYNGFGSDSERLMRAIIGFNEGISVFKVGTSCIPNIFLVYKAFEPWIKSRSPNVLSLRYEDFFNSHDFSELSHPVSKIVNYVAPRLARNHDLIRWIGRQGLDPRKSLTFRKGGSGGWREEYTPAHIEAFRSVFPDEFLHSLGYNW